MATGLRATFSRRLPRFELEVACSFGPGVTALVGPSGSGKTTLLRCLAGLESPTEGQIAFSEAVWFDSGTGRNVPPQKRRVGFVFNDYALFPHMRVRENVAYAAKDAGPVQEALDLLKIAPLGDRFIHQLSAGEQQRVAIARAIASRPQLLLMDEPFSSLDAHLKDGLLTTFSALLRAQGIPAVIVTHDLDEASLLATDLLVMRSGAVLQSGPIRDVILRPNDPQVARLLGIRNQFEARVGPEGALWWQGIRLDGPVAYERPGSEVRWCVRSEEIRVATPPGMPNHLMARITHVLPTTKGMRLHVAFAADSLEVLVPWSAARSLDFSLGAEIALQFPGEAIHVFDTATSQALEVNAGARRPFASEA